MAETAVVAGLGEFGVVAGHECALVQFCAEVARVRIADHFAWNSVSWAAGTRPAARLRTTQQCTAHSTPADIFIGRA